MNKVVFVKEPVTEDSANNLMALTLYLDSVDQKRIYYWLNCPGGEVRGQTGGLTGQRGAGGRHRQARWVQKRICYWLNCPGGEVGGFFRCLGRGKAGRHAHREATAACRRSRAAAAAPRSTASR
jgi:hypothetical protein